MENDYAQKGARHYKNMRDSGVEWIGKIPEHWNTEKLQWHLFEINQPNSPIKTSNILSLTNKLGVIPYEKKGNQGNKAKENLTDYKLAYPNCIVVNSMNILIGSVGLCNYYGCVSPVYYVFAAKEENDIRFFNYLFHLTNFQKELRKYANGILEIRLRVSSSNILKRCVAIPPYNEQLSIANYLDDVCKKVDDVIFEVQSSIAKYKEWKSSIIFEAVSKGLDSNVEMKDSGVDWIGKIPYHWTVTKIGNFVSIRSGITLGKRYNSEKTLVARPYLRVANVKADRLALDDVATIMVTPEEAKKYELVPGVLLMTEGGDRDKLGRGTIWNGEIPGCLHQNHVFAVHVNEKYMLTKYLDYLTTSPVGREYFDLTAKKTTNLASTNSSTILRFTVPVPPISEQRDIVAMLDTKCKILDEIIQEKEALVRDLDAYKKSLIYEVVTGKRKVF